MPEVLHYRRGRRGIWKTPEPEPDPLVEAMQEAMLVEAYRRLFRKGLKVYVPGRLD